MKNNGYWIWALALLLLLTVDKAARSDNLIYQTQTLAGTASFINGSQDDTSSINDVYTITVTIPQALAPNLSMATITPSGWTVSCQNCVAQLSSSPTGPDLSPGLVFMAATSAVFMFSTDATGKITAWNFAISGNSSIGNGAGGNVATDSGSFTSGDVATSTQVSSAAHIYTVTTSGPKGAWTQSSLSNPAPPVAPTPAPAANVQLRTCNGTWGPVSNTVPAGVTPNASGAGLDCTGALKGYPSSWYTKVTTNGGKTFNFVTLKSLGLGLGS